MRTFNFIGAAFYIFFFSVSLSFGAGCAAGIDHGGKDTHGGIPVKDYDIFNLKWGMPKNECFSVCDWGGKLQEKVKYPILGTHLLKFEKGTLYSQFDFNHDGLLYQVTLKNIYPDTKFSTAKEFYFYLQSILLKKYKLVWDSFNYQNIGIVNSVLYERFLENKVNFIVRFESSTTQITLVMMPWTVPNSFENRIVLHLEYSSKNIKNISKKTNDSAKEKDSKGL